MNHSVCSLCHCREYQDQEDHLETKEILVTRSVRRLSLSLLSISLSLSLSLSLARSLAHVSLL